MFNLENYGIISGRLVSDPQIYENADGSRKIRITLAASNNYRNKDGSRSAQFIPLEAFIIANKAKKDNGVFDLMHIGDKITVSYTVKNNNYTDRSTGKPVYGLVLQIENVKLDESKATTAARQEAKAAETGESENTATGTRKSTKSNKKAS